MSKKRPEIVLVAGMKFRPRARREGTADANGNDRELQVCSTNEDSRGRIEVLSVNRKLGHTRRILVSAKRLRSADYTIVFTPCPETKEGTQDACATPACPA